MWFEWCYGEWYWCRRFVGNFFDLIELLVGVCVGNGYCYYYFDCIYFVYLLVEILFGYVGYCLIFFGV